VLEVRQMLQRKLATAWSVIHSRGIEAAARVSLEKAAMWWRHGAPFELGKLVGRPSSYARLDGCRFELDSSVITPSLEYLLLSGKHEAPERTLIRRHLNRTLPVVEFGGAIGVVSCVANALLDERSKHVVVEANPALLPVLEANRRRNNGKFTIEHGAIGYGSSVLRFPVAQDILESSTFVATTSMVDVPATSLRTVLDTHGFERCNLVCDIEGAEVDLVRREASVLRQHVDVLIMEVHERVVGQDVCDGMMGSLKSLGFELLERVCDTVAMRRVP
jgi:FkbM family methyltransferase